MTDKRNVKEIGGDIKEISAFYLEAERRGRGMALLINGIIGIDAFDDSFIDLKSHGGRISVNGRNLFINVYEKNMVEIVGRVEGVTFKYGKN